jgi:hypothetical protein
MAGTYGEPGKNPFTLIGVGGILSQVVNAESGVSQIYRQSAFNTYQSLGTYNPQTGKFTPNNEVISANESAAFSQEKNLKTIKDKAIETATRGIAATGKDPQTSQTEASKLISPNAALPSEAGIGTSSYSEEAKYLNEQIKSIKSRPGYESAIYPIGLNSKFQDCIKFSIVTYQKSGLKGFGESLAGSRIVNVDDKGIPEFKKEEDRKILATIVLPIPGGIQDSNTVNWSGGNLNPLAESIGSVMQAALQGKDAAAETKRQAELVNVNDARSAIISKMTEGVLGNNGVMQRQFGTIINPNLELLFNSPELRTFSFSFKLSPRSKNEAVEVKKIIRNFKQAMSVKRSTSSFLLQSPHTFAISYIFQDRSHPYLNRFKECALISCNVNYTPEGNYMSFDDSNAPSMVSYQIDLTFQELEPLYDDDYGIDPKEYDNIGF